MAVSVQESGLAWLPLLATFSYNLYQFSVSPVLMTLFIPFCNLPCTLLGAETSTATVTPGNLLFAYFANYFANNFANLLILLILQITF